MSGTDLSAALSNSLSLSSILILTALGLAITFGVMRVINMAHGEMLMLGAYTALVVTNEGYLGLNLFWAIPISFLAVGFAGFLLEVCLIRFLYGRPLDTLLATWGVGLILQQVVKLKFGANLQPMHMPDLLAGALTIGQVTIPVYRLFIVGITLACLLGVYVWFYWTSFGLKIRAVVQNRQMAAAMGISTRRVDSLTFAFASGLAGVAGCIMAHLYNVKYNMGSDYIVEAFMVVILGGVGQLAGSVAGGVLMGASNGVVAKVITSSWMIALAVGLGFSHEGYTKTFGENSESMAKFVVLLVVVGLVLLRPSGLFTVRERSYD
jgi:urea transport system permease protein